MQGNLFLNLSYTNKIYVDTNYVSIFIQKLISILILFGIL